MAFRVRFWGEIHAVARLMDELTSPDSRGDAGFLLAGVSSVYIVRGHLKQEEKKNERTGLPTKCFFWLGLGWINIQRPVIPLFLTEPKTGRTRYPTCTNTILGPSLLCG